MGCDCIDFKIMNFVIFLYCLLFYNKFIFVEYMWIWERYKIVYLNIENIKMYEIKYMVILLFYLFECSEVGYNIYIWYNVC